MNHKLLILLFGTVFYCSVKCSSVNEQNPETVLAEEKPPTVPRNTTEHINKKIEGNTSSTAYPNIKKVTVSKVVTSSSQTIKSAVSEAVTTVPPAVVSEKDLNEPLNYHSTEIVPLGKNITESAGATNAGLTTATNAAMPTTALNNKTSITSTTVAPVSITDHPSVNTTNHPSVNTTNHPSVNTTNHPSVNTTNDSSVNTTNHLSVETTTSMKSTAVPSSTTKDNLVEHNTPVPIQEKHFDGQSFIGGMALTIGLTAIGFIAFKYYKSGKIDINYRTL